MPTKPNKFNQNFEPVENDFYRTFDPRAHEALDSHLPPMTLFAEPCAGYGDLIKGLEERGHFCSFASELIDRPEVSGQYIIMDAFDLNKEHLKKVDMIITNPPWSRKILHPMIEHFSSLKPTFLLFEADWMHTKQSSHYIKELCTDIISVGRVKWIEGSKGGGFKDCAWYKFDINKSEATKFWGRTTS